MKKLDFWDSLDSFTRQYLETALWSSTHTLYPNSAREEVITLDDYFEGKAPWEVFSMDALKQAARECEAFQRACECQIQERDPEQAGHDFWLTRNHHGAGFWDGDWETCGESLTQASHAMGERDLYVSRGLVHMYPHM